MKLVNFRNGASRGLGVLDEGRHAVRRIEYAGRPAEELLPLLEDWDPEAVRAVGDPVALSAVELLAPIPRPARNVFCVGKNYHDHSAEFASSGYDATDRGAAVPKLPIFFTKPSTTVIGPGVEIDPHRELTSSLDYEVELTVVIGRGGRGIPRERAMEHVWGYTLINDVTARDLQRDHAQWFLGKSLDTFCPMGPWVVTADELDGADVIVETLVNGELRQHANLRDLIFDIPTLISTLSAGMTLEPGDLLATGTPAGVGLGFDPPRFLQPGDEVCVRATGLGELRNRIAAA
ncbi:MAG TPA: fumarylacetoacetate hydrolase family protein [Pseudonocardia sp.]|nr:fumarylacetoacetate hydrolase family protein [Pseudonocardia sp.]